MSSQIIGELGQVGLTVPENPKRDLINKPDEDNQSSSTIRTVFADLKKKSPPSKNSRVKRFRREWMMHDIFKDWLRPHATSRELALCTACNRVIKAGKSELEKHATGKKHLSMLKGKTSDSSVAPDLNFTVFSTVSNDQLDSYPKVLQLDNQLLCTKGNQGRSSEALQHSQDGWSQESSASSQDDDHHYLHEISNAKQSSPTKAFVSWHAPHWKALAVVNGQVTNLDLNDFKERYLMMIFYPNDFCRISSSEINALSDIYPELHSLGIDIVACSVDSHLTHLAWCRVGRQDGGIAGTRIPLLADPTHSIATSYGVYLPDKGHTLRAHFLIDKRGIIRHMTVNDTPFGRSTTELVRMSKAMLYNESTEESCPVDWQPAH